MVEVEVEVLAAGGEEEDDEGSLGSGEGAPFPRKNIKQTSSQSSLL